MKTEVNRDTLELIMTRVFDAPRDLVFQMFTDESHLTQWWGPKGWQTTSTTFNPTPGGSWHYCMRSPEGQESWGISTYREVVPPERIVYTDVFADAEGNLVAEMPQMLITNEFHDEGGKTKFVARTQFATLAELEYVLTMGVEEGAGESWDRLEALLATLQ